jgi:hypothetical protein
LKDGAFKKKIRILSPNNRIKTDAGKLAEALHGKVIGRRGLPSACRESRSASQQAAAPVKIRL